MKFWQKIFFSVLIVFIVVFDAGTFVLTSYSYNFNKQRETESGIREQSVILASVKESLLNSDRILKDMSKFKDTMVFIIKPLAEYYKNQGVFLGLYDDGALIYSNTPDFDKELLNLKNETDKNITDQKLNDKRYLFVSSKVPSYANLTFVYSRDITQLDTYRSDIGRVFLVLNIAVCAVLGILIFLLLKHMTRPISKLTEITSEIANGAYNKRVNINQNDELGELADIFNVMANSVETNIEQLIKSSEDKQQFIDNLSHEIKTPLTSVLGYSEYLQTANSIEEDRIKAAGHLHDSAERLKNLSDKLLDLVYLRNEDLDRKEINVETLFLLLKNLVSPDFLKRNLHLKTIADIKTVRGDQTLIMSMLTNLVENAARASFEGGTIAVRAYFEDFNIIEVSDTGRGMDKNETEKITAPFYRVDKSRSRSFGGVGLGLSVVAQIAELHSAKIQIESEKDKGTKVKIVFTTF